jgi:hypothetical protein
MPRPDARQLNPRPTAYQSDRRGLIVAAVLDAVDAGALRIGEPYTTRVHGEIIEIVVRPERAKP